jgi:hypothetical protein
VDRARPPRHRGRPSEGRGQPADPLGHPAERRGHPASPRGPPADRRDGVGNNCSCKPRNRSCTLRDRRWEATRRGGGARDDRNRYGFGPSSDCGASACRLETRRAGSLRDGDPRAAVSSGAQEVTRRCAASSRTRSTSTRPSARPRQGAQGQQGRQDRRRGSACGSREGELRSRDRQCAPRGALRFCGLVVRVAGRALPLPLDPLRLPGAGVRMPRGRADCIATGQRVLA